MQPIHTNEVMSCILFVDDVENRIDLSINITKFGNSTIFRKGAGS